MTGLGRGAASVHIAAVDSHRRNAADRSSCLRPVRAHPELATDAFSFGALPEQIFELCRSLFLFDGSPCQQGDFPPVIVANYLPFRVDARATMIRANPPHRAHPRWLQTVGGLLALDVSTRLT